jgi:hypothetical protein
MAKFRRQALAVAVLFLVFGSGADSTGAPATGTPARLQLALSGKPGGLHIVNHGAAAVGILRAITVQKKERSTWVPITTEFNAVSSCNATSLPDKVTIAAGATLTVMPWKGYSCAGQCVAACRANIYYGPGLFRYVITRSPGMQTDTGPEFTLPAGR